MRYGARNVISGKVVGIKKGSLMCQVDVDIGGKNRVSSVMTLDSVRELGLKKGSSVTVLIKAVNVLLARED
ncbi:MAG: TOBE domain-containing protein [Polyangiaceae bacterium]